MSLSVGFDTGIKSLLASQSALQTIGNNIANANTKGYSREEVLLSETMPVTVGGMSLGTGVTIAQIRRIVDDGLEARLLSNQSTLARLSMESAGQLQIESIFNSAGGNGLPANLNSIFSSFGVLTTHPDDKANRKSVLTAGRDLANALRDLSSRLADFRDNARFDANLRVEQANSISSQIADLNGQIANLKTRNIDAHALSDRRQQLLGELSQIVEVTTIADQSGMTRVLVAGSTIVSGTKSYDMVIDRSQKDEPVLRVKSGVGAIAVGNGAVAGLLKLSEQSVSGVLSQANSFAKSLILAFNRVHTTGVPTSGGFESIQGATAPATGALGATVALSAAGYDTEIQKGELYITVQNKATGEISKSKVAVDPSETLTDFAAKLSSIGHLSASIDAAGKLRISADAGYQFDFSPRLDSNPDAAGSFGGSAAAVTSGNAGPFALTNGASMTVNVDNGPAQTITFQTSQFADITKATAEEVAAAINSQITGAKAVADHGRISLVSDTSGTTSTIQIADGSGAPNAQFGFSLAQDSGSATAANATISGSYAGAANDQWTFRADGDGQIGVSPNLTVGVFDSTGNRIATLSVGEGYSPGTKLVVKDGVEVSFGPGEISNVSKDSFSLDVVANSDSSDVLSALGLNTFFTGESIDNIAMREDLMDHPELLASSLNGAALDAGNLNRFLQIQKLAQDGLGGATLPGFLTEMTSDIALDTKRTGDLESAQNTLVSDLSSQREQISGVSMEEEMANMVRFQQAFTTAGRYLQVLQQTTASLLELIR